MRQFAILDEMGEGWIEILLIGIVGKLDEFAFSQAARVGDRRLEQLFFESRCVRTSDRSDAFGAQRDGLLPQLGCD